MRPDSISFAGSSEGSFETAAIPGSPRRAPARGARFLDRGAPSLARALARPRRGRDARRSRARENSRQTMATLCRKSGAKMALGIIAWIPLLMSTICDTRKSTARLAKLRRTGGQFFNVDIPRVLTGCRRTHRLAAASGNTEGALKRLHIQFDVRRELNVSVGCFQMEIVNVSARKFVGKDTRMQFARVMKIRSEIDRAQTQEAYFEEVAALGAVDGDRPNDAVNAAAVQRLAHGGESIRGDPRLQATQEMRPRANRRFRSGLLRSETRNL